MTMQLNELELMSSEEKCDLLVTLLESGSVTLPPLSEQARPTRRISMDELRFELLGPLVIRCGEQDMTPSAPKMRALLAMLLFNANSAVGYSVLESELWGETPPRTAQATTQTYVFKLRKRFAEVLGRSAEYVNHELLSRTSTGYILRVAPHKLDVTEFERLVNNGSAALRDGDFEDAASNLRRSLALWRGPVDDDSLVGTHLRAQAARLGERRIYAQAMLHEANLCLGRHREAVSELTSLVVECPLHESAHAMLMIALHRAGRTSAALEVFLRFRRRMSQELGIEPSARIQALHMALLSNDALLNARGLTSEMLLDRLTGTGGENRRR